MKWDAQAKMLFAKLVLCGCTFELRSPRRTVDLTTLYRPYVNQQWYFKVPAHVRKDYMMGGYNTKSEAVHRAAEIMGVLP